MMVNLLRKVKETIPTEKTIDKYSTLKMCKGYLKNPNLWKWNAEPVSRGVAFGIFAAFLPLPCQMLIAALLSVMFRGNLGLAIALTWLSNPFTFLPLNYFIYKVGALVTGQNGGLIFDAGTNIQFDNFSLFWVGFKSWFSQLSKPFLIGVPIVSIGMAFLGYFSIKIGYFVAKILNKN